MLTSTFSQLLKMAVMHTCNVLLIVFCCVGVLAGGTGAGHVAMWKYSPLMGSRVEPEDRWKLQPPSTIHGTISQLAVGTNTCLDIVCVP